MTVQKRATATATATVYGQVRGSERWWSKEAVRHIFLCIHLFGPPNTHHYPLSIAHRHRRE